MTHTRTTSPTLEVNSCRHRLHRRVAGDPDWTKRCTGFGDVGAAAARRDEIVRDPSSIDRVLRLPRRQADGVFFPGLDGGRDRELYFSDGTAAGTGLACDLFPGSTWGRACGSVADIIVSRAVVG